MTVRAVTATVGQDGSTVFDVPTMRDVPDDVTFDEACAVMDAAVKLAELCLIDAGQVPGDQVRVRVFYTDAERRAAADLTQ